MVTRKEEFVHKNHVADEELKSHLLKQQMLFDQQQRDIQVGRNSDSAYHFNLANASICSKLFFVFVGTKEYS